MEKVSGADAAVLRELAERKARAAEEPENLERRELWYRHNGGERTRPLVLAEVGGVLDEVLPDSVLRCAGTWARELERRLRIELYEHEVLRDDHVVEPWVDLGWDVEVSGWVDETEISIHHADNEGRLGARSWDPPIRDLDRDLGKLRPRVFAADRGETAARKAELERVLEGILKVRLRGPFWWTMGMTWVAIDLIGLEGLMLALYDRPEGLHALMDHLCREHLRYAEWLQTEGLLGLNNENDYIGSGSMGYARDLPAPGYAGTARLEDLWVLLESQETVGVSPDQFAEFVLPYQRRIAERFGRCYYGCCEPVHGRWTHIATLPNLRSVSVSPWADERYLAEKLGDRYVYSRKPAPTLVSTPRFDGEAIRADLRRTFDIARECRVEVILKDVHTVAGHPERLAAWVRIAREEAGR